MKHVQTIIIGGGQAGLAMSRCLTDRGADHLVLERGRLAERWRGERWESLRLLTPRWQTRLPGWSYQGPDPDGFMSREPAVALLPVLMLGMGAFMAVLFWSVGGTPEGAALPPWLGAAITSATLGLLLLLHLAILGIGLGWPVSIPFVGNLGIGLLLLLLGWILPRVPPNPLVGVRTPRTVGDPEAWARANRIGGKWMRGAGVVVVAAGFLPGVWPLVVLFGAVAVAAGASVLQT